MLLVAGGVDVVICWVVYIVAAGFLDGGATIRIPFISIINILFAIFRFDISRLCCAAARWLVVVAARRSCRLLARLAFVTARLLIVLLFCC